VKWFALPIMSLICTDVQRRCSDVWNPRYTSTFFKRVNILCNILDLANTQRFAFFRLESFCLSGRINGSAVHLFDFWLNRTLSATYI
jgi:hypothetical protein